MPSVQRTFTVTPPPAEVLDYLKDFANATEWDPFCVQDRVPGSHSVALVKSLR